MGGTDSSFALPAGMQDERLLQVRAHPSSPVDHNKEELEVVKAIILREEYISRVRANLRSQGSKFGKDLGEVDGLISLLDLLRSATIDVVETIQQWRRIQGNPEPFVWQGMNYLLKIPIDVNFLDGYKVRFTTGFGCADVSYCSPW